MRLKHNTGIKFNQAYIPKKLSDFYSFIEQSSLILSNYRLFPLHARKKAEP